MTMIPAHTIPPLVQQEDGPRIFLDSAARRIACLKHQVIEPRYTLAE
jgi:hypothetical protein